MRSRRFIAAAPPVLVVIVMATVACTCADKPLLRWNHSASELKIACKAASEDLMAQLNLIAQSESTNFFELIRPLDTALTEFNNKVRPLAYYGSMALSPSLRQAGQACYKQTRRLAREVFARRDLWRVVRRVELRHKALQGHDRRLLLAYRRAFPWRSEQSGAEAFPAPRSDLQTYGAAPPKRAVAGSQASPARLSVLPAHTPPPPKRAEPHGNWQHSAELPLPALAWQHIEPKLFARGSPTLVVTPPAFSLPQLTSLVIAVYERLLHIELRPLPAAARWHSDVSLYEVVDRQGRQLALVYFDLQVRVGKTSVPGVFALQRGYRDRQGRYLGPTSVIVANLAALAPLRHLADLKGFSFNLGAIVLQALNEAPYPALRALAVKRSFVATQRLSPSSLAPFAPFPSG